jgi:hypothetical protein
MDIMDRFLIRKFIILETTKGVFLSEFGGVGFIYPGGVTEATHGSFAVAGGVEGDKTMVSMPAWLGSDA